MGDFYEETLEDLISTNVLDKAMSILVVCGGERDKEVFQGRGFQKVVICNVDTRVNGSAFAPYHWSLQDAEKLGFSDNSFDFCIVHWGLHHCYSPHRALLEMYRVATKGLLIIEPYDNLLTRLGVLFRVSQEYEHSAVFNNYCSYGGLRDSSIPNYIYRWKEKEIVKCINTFAPYGEHRYQFIHGSMRLPWRELKNRNKKFYFYITLLFLPILRIISFLFPKCSNTFAALILKPELPRDLHPWLLWGENEIKPNRLWLSKRYKPRR